MLTAETVDNIKECILAAERICLVTHHNPDGDAIGSALGLMHCLRQRAKHVEVIVPNDFPAFLHWMPGCDQVTVCFKHRKKAERIIAGASLLVFLDFNSPDRVNDMEELIRKAPAKKILIDHHPHPENFADHSLSVTEVSSTAELICLFLKQAGWEDSISQEAAVCLFTGIMTDTVSFSVNASRPSTYQVIAGLMDRGIDKEKIHAAVFDNFSANRMRLLGYALNEKMVILPEYHTAYISLSREELCRYQFAPGDSEGFVNYPLSIKGIWFSALFMEKRDHIKISFRSRGSFAVNRLAEQYFQGGGHLNAAGGQDNGSLEEVLDKFNRLLPGYQKELEESVRETDH